jgi:hypothetical protein
MKTWAICVGLFLGASWAFGGAGGRSITLDINQQDRAFSNTVARGEAYDWEIYLTRGGSSYTQETFTGGGVYYSTSRTASAWVVFPFSSWSATGGRVVCRMAATNSLGLSTNAADYPIAYDASIILTTSNNVYRWRQGVLAITDDGAISGSTAAAVASGMVPSSRTITINGVGYDLTADRSWTVTAAAPTNTAWSTVSGTPTTLSGYGITDAATAAQGIAATNAQERVAVLETNAVLRGDTNGWTVSSHASFLTAESDPVFATNGAPRSWVAGFETAPVLWDADYLVPSVTMPDGTVGQMFEEIYVTIRNTSGITITNGKAVRATSSSGYYSGATLASCTDTFDHVLGVIGLATMNITNGGTGKITLVGNVNDINTTAFTEGSNLWLSTTAGELTMTKPTAAGCNQVLIGTCLRKNANVGRIGVAVRIVPLPENIGAVATNDALYLSALQPASTQSLVSISQLATATNAAIIDATQRVAATGYLLPPSTQNLVTASQLATATNSAIIDATQRVSTVGYLLPANTQGLATVAQLAAYAPTSSISFYAAPACYQVTITNTSALSFTNNWSPTQSISRITATSTGTVTFVMNWPASQMAYWGFCYDATGRPSTVFPAGAIYYTNGVYGSTAPSLGVSNYISVKHDCASYQIMAFTNTLGTWGTP